MKYVCTYVSLHECVMSEKVHWEACIAGVIQQEVLAYPSTIPTEQDHCAL